MSNIDEIIKDLPENLQKAIKTLCTTMYNKGIAIGAYTISDRILSILRSESNPAKAKAQVIQFIKSNKDIKKKENDKNEIHN